MSGLYIVLEGPDYTGKSSLIAMLSDHLIKAGHETIVTGHPGSTQLGQELRKLIKTPDIPADKQTRAIMLAADNCQFQREIALPAAKTNKYLLADRSNFISSMAYQIADGIPMDDLRTIHQVVGEYRKIDVCFILDVDYKTRCERQKARGIEKDYFERDELHYEKLRNSYSAVINNKYVTNFIAPGGIITKIDSTGTREDVLAQMVHHLNKEPDITN